MFNKALKKLECLKAVFFDFDGVFTNNKVWIDENGIESVCCSRVDGIGIQRLRKRGIFVAIVSAEVNPVVSVRAKKLDIDCFQGINEKGEFLEQYMKEQGFDKESTAYLGNDVNDLPAFQKVGVKIAVSDAVVEVIEEADIILEHKGGYGAVRELCDWIYNSGKRNGE